MDKSKIIAENKYRQRRNKKKTTAPVQHLYFQLILTLATIVHNLKFHLLLSVFRRTFNNLKILEKC